jgi:hypothetical protein
LRAFACVLVLAGCAATSGPPGSPSEVLLARSIEVHDPSGRWGRSPIELSWSGTTDTGEERVALEMVIGPGDAFEMEGRYRGASIQYSTDGDRTRVLVDGEQPDPEARERLALDRDGGLFWRNYHRFLAGLPMNLAERGVRLDEEPVLTRFQDREVLAVRATFEAGVGDDVWYAYFDPESSTMVGCRFYHDEAANDGEYIVFEGAVEGDGLRLPQSRRWYVDADGRYLGEDVITRVAIH